MNCPKYGKMNLKKINNNGNEKSYWICEYCLRKI